MQKAESFTIVIPTRDNVETCKLVLEQLVRQGAQNGFDLRIVFLVNDTTSGSTSALHDVLAEERFAQFRPVLLYARQNWPSVEENIRYTLGENLTAVDEHFLIIGNSDTVNLSELKEANEYMIEHQLALLLIGVMNREVYRGQAVRQLYATPRHLNPKNRLPAEKTHGSDVFRSAMADYGPVDYLAYIGCQIYTKAFFREMCGMQAVLSEAVYSIPLASLELTSTREWAVGFWPAVVVVRVDHLQYGANSAQQPQDWWVARQRTERGLSNHLMLAVLSSSLQLSSGAFETLVNSFTVSIARGKPQYIFANLLYLLVQQICGYVQHAAEDSRLKYSATELSDIARFAERLGSARLGMPVEQQKLMSQWLCVFGRLGDRANPPKVEELLSPAATILSWLDGRAGMERWVAQLSLG